MPSAVLIGSLIRELLTCKRSPRIPEPGLVMDDPEQVSAYVSAGREHGVMAPVYLFHGANICEVIRPGDTVLDLACGPANQLALVARLNPETRFIGMDLSKPMLQQAEELIAQQGLANVSFRHGDITDLSEFPGASIDAVMSTMALHHLPDAQALARVYAEVARVLKIGGGVYMVDFSHLRLGSSIEYFAYQYADRQPALFTTDYLNSLHAAFYLDDIRLAVQPLAQRARLHTTFLVPYMAALKSPGRRGEDLALEDIALKAELVKMAQNLPDWHKADFADLKTFFGLGGLTCSLLR